MTEENNRTELLREIKDELIAGKHLPLYKERTKNKVFPVIGEGSHYAKIMFIGEAPGKNEAEQGRPFCGASGRILDELLASTGISRPDVYITNIVKDRPPMNRDPLPEEIEIYAPFLDRQINIIQPKIIITLGRFSSEYIMGKFELRERFSSIGEIHGKTFLAQADYGDITITPMYHPAATLYGTKTKGLMEKDWKMIKKFMIKYNT